MPASSLRPASAADRPVLERLWQLFAHDISERSGMLPGADGAFPTERLVAAFEDADRQPHLVVLDGCPVGFAVVRGLSGPARVVNAFFVVRSVRRRGVGREAATAVLALHPGAWEVPFQDDNAPAVAFWRRVAQDAVGDAWTEERRPVPGRPDAAPDVWICFDTSGAPQGPGDLS